ncbi:O-antigen ligase family protein [Patescibacteria group bacterium]|nr:O-antigen ligase family protein [Patescibacteria group bacterium]
MEKILFYLLVFCLPFQTRKIVYQWGGDFNEWTSIYLYLTDILLVLILLSWLWRNRRERFFKNSLNVQIIKSPNFWLAAFLLISLISLIQADNIQLGAYQWIKLLELTALFFYCKYNFKSLFNFERLAHVFVLSGFIQSIIAISQFVNQKSLGLRFLFESPLGPEISGVAKIVNNNFKMIRAYGTFPHPNILAAFLLISIFFFYFIWLNKKHSFAFNLLLIIVYGILIIALGFTFSRTIIFIFLISSIFYFIVCFRQNRKKIFALFLLFIILCSSFLFLAWPEISNRFQISLTEQSIGLRSFYAQISFLVIQEHPWLGMGIGNFVWEIRQMLDLLSSWVHQPVHNIYLLIGSEVGLIGLVMFLMFLFILIRQFREQKEENIKQYYLLLFLISGILIISLFDHFFWTLQQGQLMFWLILGIIASQIYQKKETLG